MHCYFSLKLFAVTLAFFFAFATDINAQQENKLAVLTKKETGSFAVVAGKSAATISFGAKEEPVVHTVSQALKEDIKAVSGITPALDSSGNLQSYSIIIGTIGKHGLIDDLIANKKLDTAKIKGKWEAFTIAVINQPFPKVKQALVIAGSDSRGTAFGVFELSRLMGVSPFYWWADITPERKQEIYVTGSYMSQPPSVKYRGIFINDEDWGLQPWAAKTFEPETKDIGPKTYAKVFELLLRLKANLVWPAMHPSTEAFFHYPGNVKVAEQYAIVIGSSHAEPMLRNNVSEWNEKTMGHFNYITNKETVYKYWEDRIKESSGINAVYTVGMRGVHDGQMEGVKTPKEAVPLLEQIFDDQRNLLSRYVNKDVTAVPQAFTAYKEVLEVYDNGLKVPYDVTLVWPDDNYGYIQRLNNEKEGRRKGGAGVYYHASYWGRPHDYIWLPSTHPSLMREEMVKAHETGADRLWVLNVGDIKPIEYNTQLFLDMAYNVKPFKESRYTKQHLQQWATSIFGRVQGQKTQAILWDYFTLAFERKPEFMGWSQVEPETNTAYTQFNHFYFGDEAQKRIDKYDALAAAVQGVQSQLAPERRDAFYELVTYPVVAAGWLNKKFLYRDKAYFYSKQNRLSAYDFAELSKNAYDSIVKETAYYNNVLAAGKWSYMMTMNPRNLKVYRAPDLPTIKNDSTNGWSIAPEGYVTKDSSLTGGTSSFSLPLFDNLNRQKYFIDVFLNKAQTTTWTATVSHPWIRLSKNSGQLTADFGAKQVRIWVDVDWSKVPAEAQVSGQINFKTGNEQRLIDVQINKRPNLSSYKGFVEANGYVSIHAAHFSRRTGSSSFQWQVLDGFGYTGKALQAPLAKANRQPSVDTTALTKNSIGVEYDFYTFTAAPLTVVVFTLPTHPLNNAYRMRYAVSVDNGPVKIVDFKTFGRSEEWKQNVLRNRAERRMQLPVLNAGSHTLKIFAVDPGVILDEIRLDLGGLKNAYGVLTETKQHL